MTVQPLIRSLLLADPDIIRLAEDRVYDIAPPSRQTRLPAAALQRIAETIDAYTLTARTVMQIDSYGYTHADASALADAVSRVMTGMTADNSTLTILSGVRVNTTDFYTTDSRIYRVSADYAVVWRTKS